ncbi:MAG: GNAT family N-acetyltransferase [Anaerolineales bacterium]|nr:GNAT family N-acetyltransferase [Anaerolineales bacterium]
MQTSFEPLTESDIPKLTGVMTRAFDDDSRKHLGVEKGGPDGYDNGDFFRKWLFGHKETDGYKVIADGKAVGGIIVWIFPHGDNILGIIFIDPEYQDRGIGSAAWKFIERRYPQTKSWRLATPAFAMKNHFFYEAMCGFTRFPGGPAEEYQYRKIWRREKHNHGVHGKKDHRLWIPKPQAPGVKIVRPGGYSSLRWMLRSLPRTFAPATPWPCGWLLK